MSLVWNAIYCHIVVLCVVCPSVLSEAIFAEKLLKTYVRICFFLLGIIEMFMNIESDPHFKSTTTTMKMIAMHSFVTWLKKTNPPFAINCFVPACIRFPAISSRNQFASKEIYNREIKQSQHHF